MSAGPRAAVDLADLDLTDLDLFTDGFPHDTFRALRESAPVHWHAPTPRTPDGEGFWVLSRYEDVLHAAADAATFSSDGSTVRPDGGGTLIEDLPGGFAAGVLLNMMDDPRHQQVRKLVAPTVSPRAVAAMSAELRTRAERVVDEAIDRSRRDGVCDFVLDVAAELPLQAIASLMGVPQADRHRLFGWATANLEFDDRELGETDEHTRAANAALFEYGTALIAERRTGTGTGTGTDTDTDTDTDIITAAVDGRLPDGEPLTDLELQMLFNLLVAAGSETTRNSIAGGVLALVADPDRWSALASDRSRLPTAVEEILRWTSATTYNRRTATRDVELHGRHIRRGDKVTLWWPSANRDPDQFPDPDRFDFDRSPNRHLAFGHGTHFCLGASVARLEIRLVLDALLDRVAAIEPAGPVRWSRTNKHTGIRHMPVVLVPR